MLLIVNSCSLKLYKCQKLHHCACSTWPIFVLPLVPSCLCSSSALPLFHPSLCAHSSRSRYGQRQRQRRHRSPGGDHRKRGGACGGAWWQAAKVPWWVTAIFFFFFCFMEKSFWIPEPQFYHSDLFSDIWNISFPSWETECWNRGVTTGLVKMIICRIVITKPWSFHYHKQGFSAFYASKQHVLCRFFFNVRKYVKFK